VLYDQNPDFVDVESVDHGVRKDLHRKAATPAAAASADLGLLDQQGRQALEFGDEPRGQRRRAFALMEGRSIQKVSLGPGGEGCPSSLEAGLQPCDGDVKGNGSGASGTELRISFVRQFVPGSLCLGVDVETGDQSVEKARAVR